MSVPPFRIVLVEPEIPPNTGNVARLCAATGAELHLIEPLGFEITDRALKRAGLDYWDHVHWKVWPSWDAWVKGEAGGRYWLFTTKAARPYWEVEFAAGDGLVFGRETRGLPESLLAAQAERCCTIPMEGGPGARSLNLATAAAIGLYEGLRQIRRR
jgi:tRNA (cytidine/uridine-2'-O-)-methyltransferase